MFRILTIVLFLLNISYVKGQGFSTYLKENAIEIQQLENLPVEIYNQLKGYQLIMIGEMHGTNEPAGFITGLAELFAKQGNIVQVGFEIPADKMKLFQKHQTKESIWKSEFFKNNSADGRANAALAKAIEKLSKNPKVKIFFYDVTGNYDENRDSLMYLNIKYQIQQHPAWTTITLSGNVHNMLLPFRNEKKTSLYLKEDAELNLQEKLCSLTHLYQYGTMLNNMGNGLELKTIKNQESVFSELGYDKYLILYPAGISNIYSGTFFTREVSAAVSH